jgi:hypothetical protein
VPRNSSTVEIIANEDLFKQKDKENLTLTLGQIYLLHIAQGIQS